jgi:hypothetical protein
MNEQDWQAKHENEHRAEGAFDGRGKFNRYTCTACGFSVLTIDRAWGATPFIIACKREEMTGRKCVTSETAASVRPSLERRSLYRRVGEMHSGFYRCEENLSPSDYRADYEWYRPAWNDLPFLTPNERDHVERGGLLLRRAPGALTPVAQCESCGHVLSRHHEKCDVTDCYCPEFEEPPPGEFTCPRRDVVLVKKTDYWSSARWNPFYRHQWPEEFSKPLTCSYCGCAEPNAALYLIARGWEIDMQRDWSKATLYEPGWFASLYDKKPKLHAAPIPPVKIYGAHFDAAQWELIVEKRHKL